MKLGVCARFVFGLLATCLASSAHSAILTVASADLPNGATEIELAISLDVAESEAVASAQFELRFPDPPLGIAAITAGATAISAGKSVVSNALESGRYRVIVAGLNQNRIADGELALVNFTLAPATTDARLKVLLEGVVLADPTGRAVSATLVNGQLTVGNPEAVPEPPPSACGCGTTSPRSGHGDWAIMLLAGVVLLARRKPETAQNGTRIS